MCRRLVREVGNRALPKQQRGESTRELGVGSSRPAPCPRGLAGAEPLPPSPKQPIAGAELWVLGKAGERDCPEALPLAQHLLSSREELFHHRKIWTEITP